MNLTNAATCTTAATSNTLTASEILARMRVAEERIKAMRTGMSEFTRVITNRFCTAMVPVRPHKKRRNQSEAYHRRIQKKWVKRFGEKNAPAAFLIDNRFLGGHGKTLVLHPALMP